MRCHGNPAAFIPMHVVVWRWQKAKTLDADFVARETEQLLSSDCYTCFCIISLLLGSSEFDSALLSAQLRPSSVLHPVLPQSTTRTPRAVDLPLAVSFNR